MPEDRELWLDVRRHLLAITRAIEVRYGLEAPAKRLPPPEGADRSRVRDVTPHDARPGHKEFVTTY